MIVAFSGKRGSGKSLSSQYLVRFYGFQRIGFADALKELAQIAFPFKQEHLWGNDKETKFKDYEWTPRQFMVNLGMFMRYYDTDYWVNRLVDSLPSGKNIVIDDLRFLNECVKLKEIKAKLVRLNRYPKDRPSVDYEVDNSDSETQLDSYKDFDVILHEFENKDQKTLYARLGRMMDEFGIKRKL